MRKEFQNPAWASALLTENQPYVHDEVSASQKLETALEKEGVKRAERFADNEKPFDVTLMSGDVPSL